MTTHRAKVVPFLARSVGPLPMPIIVTTILSLVAGGLQVINQVVLKGHPETQAAIAVFLVFLVGVGISPVTGVAFRNLIHLPPWANTLITAIISAGAAVLQIAAIGHTAQTIVLTILTVLAALGFGASQGSVIPHVVTTAAPHPHRRA